MSGDAKPRRFVRMFKPQFAPLVESGAKLQTVRPTPKRMPRPGDVISLRAWTGSPYRSTQRVLREAVIVEVRDIAIFEEGPCVYADQGADWSPGNDGFAKADGFSDWMEMREWFRKQHGLPFKGILITWSP